MGVPSWVRPGVGNAELLGSGNDVEFDLAAECDIFNGFGSSAASAGSSKTGLNCTAGGVGLEAGEASR